MEEGKKILFWQEDSKVKVVPLKLGHNKSYLDTGTFMQEVKTEIYIKFKILDGNIISNSHWPNIFGTNDSPWLTFEFSKSGSYYRVYFNIGSSTYLQPVEPSQFVWPSDDPYEMSLIIDPAAKTWSTTGTWTSQGTYTGSIANQTMSLLVGLRQRSYSYTCNMLVYEFAIKKNGILVQQFIPTLDKDGNACFYESVSKTLFYSAGEGAFEIGEDEQI